MNLGKIWMKVCMVLQKSMNPLSYTTWIRDNMFPLSCEKEEFIIAVKMRRMIPLIERTYSSIIQKAVEEAVGHPVNLRFIYSEDGSPPFLRVTQCALNPEWTFDSFKVNDNNRLAFISSYDAATNPARFFSPLFLYGPPGSGKTRLLHSIGNYVSGSKPMYRVLFISSRDFVKDIVFAMQNRATIDMRKEMRMADILLMDDIEDIAGRERTQIEVLHLFDDLLSEVKPIVIAGNSSPQNLPRFINELRTRLAEGTVVEMLPPETKRKDAY